MGLLDKAKDMKDKAQEKMASTDMDDKAMDKIKQMRDKSSDSHDIGHSDKI